MKEDKIIKIIFKNTEKDHFDLNLISKIINSNLLTRKELLMFYKKLYPKIKENEVILESSTKIKNLKEILNILDNPKIYKIVLNPDLIAGIRIKSGWNIIDTSIKNKLEKIKSIN
jgi:F0F1-type ATP synthase delta subunit